MEHESHDLAVAGGGTGTTLTVGAADDGASDCDGAVGASVEAGRGQKWHGFLVGAGVATTGAGVGSDAGAGASVGQWWHGALVGAGVAATGAGVGSDAGAGASVGQW
jgi:hypothetical protein